MKWEKLVQKWKKEICFKTKTLTQKPVLTGMFVMFLTFKNMYAYGDDLNDAKMKIVMWG